jgi:WXG100 family type VII secretion target
MSLIKVTSQDLQTLGGQVQSGSAQIEEQLNTLQNQVAGVVGGDWMGLASGAFDQCYQEWNTSAASLKEALAGISTLLLHAGTAYEQTETGIASLFNT